MSIENVKMAVVMACLRKDKETLQAELAAARADYARLAGDYSEEAAYLRTCAENAKADAIEAWRQVHLLKAETSGPDGFATWKDAATDERLRRVKAEAEAARLQGCRDELREIAEAINDPRLHNTITIAEWCKEIQAQLNKEYY